MIDIKESVSIQDMALAVALGISEDELDRHNLHRMKNKMFNRAFNMREEEQTISQEEANELNEQLRQIQAKLCDHDDDYDPGVDYIIDFNSFVPENSYYNKFYW